MTSMRRTRAMAQWAAVGSLLVGFLFVAGCESKQPREERKGVYVNTGEGVDVSVAPGRRGWRDVRVDVDVDRDRSRGADEDFDEPDDDADEHYARDDDDDEDWDAADDDFDHDEWEADDDEFEYEEVDEDVDDDTRGRVYLYELDGDEAEGELPPFVRVLSVIELDEEVEVEVVVNRARHRLQIETDNVGRLALTRASLPLDAGRSVYLKLDGQAFEWLPASYALEFAWSPNSGWVQTSP